MHALALALWHAGCLAHFERNPVEGERYSSDLIELSTRHHFAHWLVVGRILRGWALSALGNTAEGIVRIEDGIRDYRAMGAIRGVPFFLALKAEALHLANRIPEGLAVIGEADSLVDKYGDRNVRAPLQRLRGVFLAAMGAEEVQIEASFSEAIKTAKEQKSVSLEKRAEATYAEYRRQKASGSQGRGFRLPLW